MKKTTTGTLFPDGAPVSVASDAKRISDGDWSLLANDLYQAVTTAYAVRQPMEENLRDFNALYEMEVDEKNEPFVGCSNVFIPIIPTKVDTLLAQVVEKVLVPEFYMVSGNTDAADQVAYKVQRYYNAEFRRQRGASTWFDAHVRWLHLALRDGTSYMEVLWKRRERQASFSIKKPKVDAQGLPSFDEDGQIEYEEVTENQTLVDYDDVEMRPVLLRDIMLIPDESFNCEEAVGIARCLWLYESDLMEMVRSGLLDKDWVERALDYDPAGTSDVASDRQGIYDKTIGGQIAIGQGQGPVASPYFKNRGPLKVWRIHTRQFDMDKDGIVEENVFWLHELSSFLLGWKPAEYISPERPFFALTPFPRPDRAYGYSVIERLAPINAEINAVHNQRNDEITMRTSPPYLYNRNEEIHDKENEWGPGKGWAVADVANSVRMLPMQDIPIASWQEESLLASYADQVSGLGAVQSGGGNSGRRSAKEVEIASSASSVRADLIAMFFRIAARRVINYANALKRQYMHDDNPDRLAVTREMLAQDLKIEVAGTSDPLDKQTHLNEMLAAYQLLSQNRDIAMDAQRRYNLTRKLLEAFGFVDIQSIIGTEEDAAQRKQQEQQLMQQQLQDQQQLTQGKVYQETGGHGVQNGQQQQQQAQQQAQQQQGQPGQGPGVINPQFAQMLAQFVQHGQGPSGQ